MENRGEWKSELGSNSCPVSIQTSGQKQEGEVKSLNKEKSRRLMLGENLWGKESA